MVFENCLTFALRVGRYYRNKDHLTIRKSKWGWFPHFAVIFEFDDYLIKVEYVPTKPKRQWFLPLFFEGEVRETYYMKTESIPPEIMETFKLHLNLDQSKKAQNYSGLFILLL